jgi:hypothetical protein
VLLKRFACLALLTIVCGCSGPTEKRLPTVPTKGTLQIDGKAFGPCLLQLTIDPAKEDMPVVNGYVKADGTFALKTYVEGDGAPAGTYQVRLNVDPMSPGVAIPVIKPTTVQVAKPSDGKELVLDIKLEGTGSGETVSPLPMPGQEGRAQTGGGSVFPGSK